MSKALHKRLDSISAQRPTGGYACVMILDGDDRAAKEAEIEHLKVLGKQVAVIEIIGEEGGGNNYISAFHDL